MERDKSVDSFEPSASKGSSHRASLRTVPALRAEGAYERFVKPSLDRVAGLAFSIITLPVVALVVPMIWLTIGRPAIFRQERVGRFGEVFTVFKFRTMTEDRRTRVVPFDGTDRRVTHKSKNDPRHTTFGRFLRKWSLDEIPQFWNVALGDMSLVGPRPELPEIVAGYEEWQHRRHSVKPGLTGLWQISARGDTPMHHATHIDIEYVESLSFREDIAILLRTPAAMMGSQRGR